MYYIYNMRKTILIFIACMFRACLSVMAQTLPDTTIAPAKPTGYITIPQPSYGYSLSGGGIMNPYMYISGLSKYWRLATTQWTRLNYARLSGGNNFVGNQSFAENVYFGGTSSLTGLRNWQFVNGGDYNSPLLNGNATIGATPVQFFASRSGGFPNSNGDTEGYYPSRIEYGTNGWRFVMPTSVAGYNEFSFQTADRVARLRLGNNGETYLQVPATATGDILTINPTTGKFGRVSASTVGGVTDFNGRNGSVAPVIGDYSSFFTTPAQVTSQITSTANKNLGGGYGVNALFYNPVSQAANVSVDTTQIKSKAGALIDYTNLSNRIKTIPATYVSKIKADTTTAVKTLTANPIIANPGETSSVTLLNANGFKSTINRSVTNNTFNIKSDVSNQGAIGAAISFNPTNVSQQQYATASDVNLPTGTTPFIISTWFKTTSNFSLQPTLLQYGDVVNAGNINTNRVQIRGQSNTTMYILGSGLTTTLINPTPINDGMWHLVVFTFNGTTVRGYIDGVQRGTAPYSSGSATLSGTMLLGAAKTSNTVSTFYQGLLQQVLVYNATGYTDLDLLNAASSIYGNGIGTPNPPVTGRVRRYDFNSTSDDATGNANATLVNSPIYDVNGYVSSAGSIQPDRTTVESVNGGRGGFYGTHYLGDPLGLAMMRGSSAGVLINSFTPFYIDKQGHSTFDLTGLGANTVDASGSQSPNAVVKINQGNASVSQLQLAPQTTITTPNTSTAGGFYMGSDYRPHVLSATTDNSIAYTSDVSAPRTPFPVSSNATMVLNADYLNTTATQYTLTLPATTGFSTDGSKIITVLATGAGGLKVIVPSGYALQSGTSFATTTGTGGFTLTQGQKGQLIPIGTNSYYLQPLYGTITLY